MLASKFLTKAATVMTVLIMTLSSIQSALAAPSNDNPANPTVVFQAEVNQTEFVSSECEADVCHNVAQGFGAANIMGSVSFTFDFVQDFNITPCSPFSGVMTFEGESGTITLSDTGFVCLGSSPFGFPAVISSNWVITGGTGEFEGITGSGTSQGVIGGNGPVVHYSGTVSY